MTRISVQESKYTSFADKLDAVFVVVVPGTLEAETWKLEWSYKDGQAGW